MKNSFYLHKHLTIDRFSHCETYSNAKELVTTVILNVLKSLF